MNISDPVDRIVVRGARENRLAGVDLEVPLGELIAFTGRSGSGCRDMAVRVLHAESRTRYMQALSTFEREGLLAGVRVDVDEITGLPPSICLLDRDVVPGGSVASFLAVDVILAQVVLNGGKVVCPHCGGMCRSYADDEVEGQVVQNFGNAQCTILAPLSVQADGDRGQILAELRRAGFLRVRLDDQIFRLDEELPNWNSAEQNVEVVVDRLRAGGKDARRFREAVRSARAISRGLTLISCDEEAYYNQQLTCLQCNRHYDDLSTDKMLAYHQHELAAHVLWLEHTYAQLLQLPISQLLQVIGQSADKNAELSSLRRVLIRLEEMGLGALFLDQKVKQISTGQWLCLRVAASLSDGLAGILYVIEGVVSAVHADLRPAVVASLEQLVASGNTVIALDAAPELLAAAECICEFADGLLVQKSQGETASSTLGDLQASEKRASEQRGLRGKGSWGAVELPFSTGQIIGITGKSGVGKSRLLDEVIEPALRDKSRQYTIDYLRGRLRIHRPQRQMRSRALLSEFGIAQHIAKVYAQTPAGREKSTPADFFNLEKPGGRCPACEGRGRQQLSFEYLDDLEQTCPSCEGRCFRDELLEVTYRGVHIAAVLSMSVDRARTHFSREKRIVEILSAAGQCGLGHLQLGGDVGRLEWGEALRVQLVSARAKSTVRDVVLLDHASRGECEGEVGAFMAVLTAIAAAGGWCFVVDNHPLVLSICDSIWEVGIGVGENLHIIRPHSVT